MREAVWIVGAGALQCAMLEEAHALGLAVLMTDRDADAPGARLAETFVNLDTQDVEGHQRLAAGLRQAGGLALRGVVTCGADCAPSVAGAAEVLGTPGIALAVAVRTHNKFDVRQRLSGAGLSHLQPAYRWVDLRDPAQPYRAAEALLAHGGEPLVLKPLESCASRGVSLVASGLGDGLAEAISRARPYGDDALLEQGLTGSEHSAELIRDGAGEVLFWNVVDRVFRYTDGIPFELGHVNPSRLPPASLDAIVDLLITAADALGVTWGPFKLDLMWTADGPKILEATARLSGGWDCQATTPLSSGRAPMRAVLRLACGAPLAVEELAWQYWRYAACAAILPVPGRLVAWDPAPVIEPGPLDTDRIVLQVQRGEVIAPYTHCATRPGFAICVRDTWDEAWDAAQAAAARIAEAMQTTEEPRCPYA